MLVSKKVRTFQEPVAGKNLIESSPGFNQRRIVPNSQAYSGFAGLCPSRDFFDSPENASLPHSSALSR
jgi:hypothetical protein